MTLKQTIENAKTAAMRNGYNRIITADADGSYSIHQTHNTIWNDQIIIGIVKIIWRGGVVGAQYESHNMEAKIC